MEDINRVIFYPATCFCTMIGDNELIKCCVLAPLNVLTLSALDSWCFIKWCLVKQWTQKLDSIRNDVYFTILKYSVTFEPHFCGENIISFIGQNNTYECCDLTNKQSPLVYNLVCSFGEVEFTKTFLITLPFYVLQKYKKNITLDLGCCPLILGGSSSDLPRPKQNVHHPRWQLLLCVSLTNR